MVPSPTLANGTSGWGFCEASVMSLAAMSNRLVDDNCGISIHDGFTGRGRDVYILTAVMMQVRRFPGRVQLFCILEDQKLFYGNPQDH
jgi:hypothetical protein